MTRIPIPRSRIVLIAVLYLLARPATAAAQEWVTQADSLGFCGLALDTTELKDYARQVAFLNLQPGDTLVDIGASSGWFEGAAGCLSPVKDHHFVLVDIDTACTNERTVARMTSYYSGLHGAPLSYTYSVVHNTPRSLGLPPGFARKFLLRETLHEIRDRDRFVAALAAACRADGQVIVIEQVPTKKRERHSGCNDLLLETSDIVSLFRKGGFHLVQKELLRFPGVTLQMLRFAHWQGR
ncbi:MAG: Methyltransferase type 11 [Flaviaesturariibacter sp.]|nr:Methyltransferase type 11 [Flaviaesturariibacter sp.]